MASAPKTKTPETPLEEVVNTVVDEGSAVGVRRYFTIAGRDPFDEIEWETRDAYIPGKDRPAFEQKNVEFPKFWSQTATNIVAQKYFRGRMSSPERETSVKQMIGRVVTTIGTWGRAGGYFATEDEAETFEAELKAILVKQLAAFNSPVWFNVGFEETPQCSACQPYHAMISTPDGLVPIGELVEGNDIGREVYDANGVTRIVAVKHNGRKPVYRVTLRNGQWVEATADHIVKAVRERRTASDWLRVDQLEVGMRMHLHPHRAKVAQRALVGVGAASSDDLPDASFEEVREAAEAALAGWLQADGFVGQYDRGTNRSLTLEFQVANDDEYDWVITNLDAVFPDVHRHVRNVVTQDSTLRCRCIRLYGEQLRDFVEAWDLLDRGVDIRVPKRLWTASHDVITAYLLSIFQADGYVSVRKENGNESGRVAFAVISEKWAEDVQLLLNVIGIYSRRLKKNEKRPDRHDLHEVMIGIGSERARFAELVGFVGREKQAKLLESLSLRGPKRCPDLREEEIVSIEPQGVQDVYDIQTESGEYLSNNVAVHNCFILSIEDSMESILDWIRREGVIFRGGSGSGVNLSKIRSSKEQLSKGGHASGPVSFMRGADASAGTIKSGGKTRRAAKMVVLDVDHPDVEDFIWCKAREEKKARVLEAAGYDMSLDSPDWSSIQYQNANNSVRVTDSFMEAAANGKEWNLTARTDGTVLETRDARNLLRQIAEASWECADPGVQYDTTINKWHTLPNTGRINASNPCCFVGETLVDTDEGLLTFEGLLERKVRGEALPNVWSFSVDRDESVLRSITNVWIAGITTKLVEVSTDEGQVLRCTPEHRFLTTDGYVDAQHLRNGDALIASVGEEVLGDGSVASMQRLTVRDSVASVRAIELDEPAFVYDLEAAGEHNLTVGSRDGATLVVHNSEYMSIDDSACNLASLNLLKFRREDGEFDVEAFEHACDTVFLAQEILVGYSSYPTPEIEKNAKAFRQLGLGYANLGALLMARGFAYDSDEGRAYAAAITALMTGRAYRKSAEIAGRMGSFAGYNKNAAAMLGVISMHRASVGNIETSDSVPADLLGAARKAWDDALDLGELSGYRNAQATVLAPTGTISFMMDCDTTGVEPDFSLVKSKKLVGGGEITIVNKTVPMALDKLGYAPTEVEEIVAYVDERNTMIGAPYVKTEHYPVFDCAVGERAIHYMGHVKMMGATQPFISGAISKTVNLPETTSVGEISGLLVDAWKLGVKAIAIYRDNCKVAQPLGAKTEAGAVTLDAVTAGALAGVVAPRRRRVPEDRTEIGRKFRVGEYEGYIHVGLYEDGTPGDIFCDISKVGTTLQGLMNALMISVSLGLQYGVPLEVYVSKFSHMRFEPSGLTNDADIRSAKSIVDYIFRWMGKKFLTVDQQEEIGILSTEVRAKLAQNYANGGEITPTSTAVTAEAATPGQTALFNAWEDAVECARCGGRMIRTGSCYTCRDCGTNTGCS